MSKVQVIQNAIRDNADTDTAEALNEAVGYAYRHAHNIGRNILAAFDEREDCPFEYAYRVMRARRLAEKLRDIVVEFDQV